jgi:hypothetical protein
VEFLGHFIKNRKTMFPASKSKILSDPDVTEYSTHLLGDFTYMAVVEVTCGSG